jgi:hypothetical protein
MVGVCGYFFRPPRNHFVFFVVGFLDITPEDSRLVIELV